ncbi:hypothetical protein [Glycomyces harbinensis]|uniref:Uncharacterized protein n=1 Tax=Glycomyces harbinensis TaxID=58114 RepID=A0A1G6Y956_9ACTN|nr:hypothetical protein [Glycomyces harbinensis]SDD86781.1 hypothetical protein SAMN05216270_108201 [Glycomyces harbinensis]
MTCKHDYWAQLDPEGEFEDWGEASIEDAIGGPEEFMMVWEELGEFGDRVALAEFTGRWMQLGEHAAQLRAKCLDAGLGERLTEQTIAGFLKEVAPRWGEPESR